ncbi:MAG: MarC family protein [Thermodesulfovibrionales bacterium]|nr:MarC family protein [Nitrospinota bacterium]MCG2709349.1 MarC family protein [Thermodesulfovibrionales bacterium]
MKALINTFIPIFVAIDIFVVLPIFISITEGMSKAKSNAIVRESILTALGVSLAFIALGEAIFRVLGITADDFKIAGGLVLLVFAILDIVKHSEERRKPSGKMGMGIVPIAVPLIIGPAVLTTLLVLVDHYGILPTIVSLVLNLVVVYFSFIKAEAITKLFGRGGITAISKIMAILLASIAVMMIRIGIENIVKR